MEKKSLRQPYRRAHREYFKASPSDGRDQIIHLLKKAGVDKEISSFLPPSS